jgi:hypothetical protein
MNDNVKKQCSSSTLPKIIIMANFANAKYSTNWCCKMSLDVSLDHSRVTWLHNNGGSKTTTWLLYMVILKRKAKRSNLFWSRRVRIFIRSIFGPMNLSTQNWAFSKTKCPHNMSFAWRFNQHYGHMMPIAFISSWFGNPCSNLETKEVATCEHFTWTTSKVVVQSSHMAWVNTLVLMHHVLLAHKVKNYNLDVCCRIHPPGNE